MALHKIPTLVWIIIGLGAGTIYASLTQEWFLGIALGLTAGIGTSVVLRGLARDSGSAGGDDSGGDGGD